jgi:hypothetical protein
MICPVKLANEMSGLSGTLVSFMTRCGDEADERSRSEADDETTGRNVAGNGQTDHLVSGSGDPRASVAGRCSVGRHASSMKAMKIYSIGDAAFLHRSGCH